MSKYSKNQPVWAKVFYDREASLYDKHVVTGNTDINHLIVHEVVSEDDFSDVQQRLTELEDKVLAAMPMVQWAAKSLGKGPWAPDFSTFFDAALAIEESRRPKEPLTEYLVDFNDGIHQRSTRITIDPQPNSSWFDVTLWVREGDTFRKCTKEEVDAKIAEDKANRKEAEQ